MIYPCHHVTPSLLLLWLLFGYAISVRYQVSQKKYGVANEQYFKYGAILRYNVSKP